MGSDARGLEDTLGEILTGHHRLTGHRLRSSAYFLAALWASMAGMVLGCSEGTSPGDVVAGDYMLRFVHFASTPIQPVPAVEVFMSDTTVVERGDLTLGAEGTCALELVYRWRYGGIPGGDTVSDTLSYAFQNRATFRSHGVVDWFRLLRGPDHIAYLLRRSDGTIILIDYDRAGTMDFYFQR